MIDPAQQVYSIGMFGELADSNDGTVSSPSLVSMSEDEFRLFHSRTARPLWAYITRASGSATAAEDLVQESYLRLLGARLPPDMTEEHRRNYLYRIATNLLRDRGRVKATEVELKESVLETGKSFAAGVETGWDVQRALGLLQPRERQLLWLAYIERFSHQEIAGVVGAKAQSIRPMLARARARLASILTGGLLS